MAFIDKEESVEQGQPIELYKIQGSGQSFYYTSGQHQVTFNFDTYSPVAISRSEPEIESSQSARRIVLTLPMDNEFAARYIPTLPTTVETLTVYRYHSTDGTPGHDPGTPSGPDVIIYFSGTISNVGFKDDKCEVNVISEGKVLTQLVPKQTCRALCNHVLYDSGCKVSKVLFQLSNVSVVSIASSGLSVVLDAGSATIGVDDLDALLLANPDYFDGGLLSGPGGELRSIRSTDKTGLPANRVVIDVSPAFAILKALDIVTMTAGCFHDPTTCDTKFSNMANYGGFPFVPQKNPFSTNLNRS